MVMRVVVRCVVSWIVVALMIVGGCDRRGVERSSLLQAEETSPQVAERELGRQIAEEVYAGTKNYALAPGDVLEIIYHATAEQEVDDYRLRVDDKIEVEIAYHPDMNRVHVVRPDGKITLPLKGEIRAVGKTPAELAREIARVYADVFRSPVVNVRVQEYASKVWELRTALQTTERGQAKKITVAPDGYVYLPYVGGVKAAGRTVEDLRNGINEAYRSKFSSMEVSVLLDEVKGNKIFVFGEVYHAGLFPVVSQTTVTQALAMAGGVRRTGDTERVKVLCWDDQRRPMVKTIDVKSITEKGLFEKEFVLPRGSVVYVPKRTVVKVGEFVEDYIKNIFMFNGASLGFTYEIKGTGGN